MISEQIVIKDQEKKILHQAIGKTAINIISDEKSNFFTDIAESVWEINIVFSDYCIRIEREDINAKFFNGIEDGGRIWISTTLIDESEIKSRKTINRIVRGVSIVNDTFEFPKAGYKITYPQAVIFHFDDCNLIVERWWIFSLEGLIVHLEPINAENFGLCDELSFWYQPDDPEVFPEKPIFTQNIEKL